MAVGLLAARSNVAAMHIEMALLANYGEVREDLLYVMGGGWDFYEVPALPFGISGCLAGVAKVDANDPPHFVNMTVVGPNGTESGLLKSQHIAAADANEFGRVRFVMPFLFGVEVVGTYSVRLSDTDGVAVEIPFEVRVFTP